MPVVDADQRIAEQAPSALRDATGPEPSQQFDASPTGDTWLATHPLVLVVDDDEDARETIAAMLNGQGVSTVHASTGEAAFELAVALPISAIVLDVMLPDRTGFDVCRTLRENPETRRIPVILLTALTRVTDELTGILAGADAYLVKPVSRDRLLLHLRDVL
jgi:DNA-binding response OmpR family regulator